MRRATFDDVNCSLAKAAEAVGDAWTLLILREAFYGTRSFEGFRRTLGVARNTLTDRLGRLVEHGLFTQVDVGKRGTRLEYELTAKALDLLPTLVALLQWGDRWLSGAGHEPIELLERSTGRAIKRVEVRGRGDRALRATDVSFAAGPGANRGTRTRFAADP